MASMLATIKLVFIAHFGLPTGDVVLHVVAASSTVCCARIAFHLSVSAVFRAILVLHDFVAH
jgi:hypothetical protein